MSFLPDLSRTPELIGLCELLLHAERLSMRCTAAQARIAPAGRFARALIAQHAHEAAHVALFEALLHAAPARYRRGLERPHVALGNYERRLQAAIARGDLAASLLGLQGVMEGMGIELFRRFDACRALQPLRRALMVQDEGHHRLGLWLLAGCMPGRDGSELIDARRHYVAAAGELLQAASGSLGRAGIRVDDLDPAASLAHVLEEPVPAHRQAQRVD